MMMELENNLLIGEQIVKKINIMFVLLMVNIFIFSGTANAAVYSTTYGDVYGLIDNDKLFVGTYDKYPDGLVYLEKQGGVYEGYWAQSSSKNRCANSQIGRNETPTFYWGRLVVNETANGLYGKWSYCDSNPSKTWNATPK
ncbi:MAG: hypothetical protein HQL69_19075 [Magnetococcales bacterium]|nr:hypothetical protein [Magnetococcales bacterium]